MREYYPPRAGHLPRRHPRPGRSRIGIERPAGAVPRLAFAARQRRRQCAHRERAHFRSPLQLDVEPELALRMFEFVARHGVRLSQEAEQQIATRLPRLRKQFAESEGIWRTIEPIFNLPHTPLALRSMHDTGVLVALFPELAQMECLVVRDFFHRYTVDEHTLVAIQNLWQAGEPFSGLRSEVTQPAALLFGLLFHDSGKGLNEGHVDASLRLAEAAAQRIRMPGPDREIALYLIRSHLELSSVMQSRDIFDPRTVEELAGRVETVERLKLLTLVTYADISAVNPEVMTPWRAEQLWQVYMMAYNALTRGLETDRIQTPGPGRAEFLEGFPTRYVRTHTETEIGEHMALEERSHARGAAVDIRRLETAWQMTLAARDRPGLFAGAAGTLASFGMNILKAEAFANRRGLVLDTFAFEDPLRTLDLNPSEVERLRSLAERVYRGPDRRARTAAPAAQASVAQPQGAHSRAHLVQR